VKRIIALSVFVLGLHGEVGLPGVERDFNADCAQVDRTTRDYLRDRGFTRTQCPEEKCANILTSPQKLLDAKGRSVGTARIRRELVSSKPPLWLWSSPLHADVFLSTKRGDPGCHLRLWINFNSFHTMVAGVFPAGERLGLPSNGSLETEYLDAIEEAIGKSHSTMAP
jgi:hypothetical protein